ncbi:MAG: RtcB family protein [Desulfovibrionaceae bacterium]
MKGWQLRKMGIPNGVCIQAAVQGIQKAAAGGLVGEALEEALQRVSDAPQDFLEDAVWSELARALLKVRQARGRFTGREQPAPSNIWGKNLDPGALEQLANACRLPVSVAAALMPDAHKGYGLPIGGVLAVENAVIPYAVGVDIACRVRLSVLDMPPEALEARKDELIESLEQETRFGVGTRFKPRRRHEVMDDPAWREISVLRETSERAAVQLGTSGGGNHFAEYGLLEVLDGFRGLGPGRYVALLSHSGSRGTGEHVARHYSNLAMQMHPELPDELLHLAWFDLDSDEGREYWRAMKLMGRYSAANHEIIHRHVVGRLGAGVLATVENHHNFAWKEEFDGREVVIHRKGATPAAKGVLGVIPGSMAAPAYVVRGKGNPLSLNSAAHGAGRAMSRIEAESRFTREDLDAALDAAGVTLLSAGVDEAPMAYKDIEEVMAAQDDLVERIARFDPWLVKMAPASKGPSWRRKKIRKKQK